MNRSLFSAIASTLVALGLLAAGLYLSRGASGESVFMPHAHCYLYDAPLMLLHGGADLLIGLSYVAISTTLVWLVLRARRSLPFHWVMLAFALFIVACGATHFMEVWTLTALHPRYWIAGWVKLVTAIASVTTALVLPPLVPRLLAMMDAAKISAERGEKLERAYEELNALYRKVTELDQLKTNFFANVSHELRTPLALIFAPAERLLQLAGTEEMRREVSLVRRNAFLLHKHVNDLLDVSKLEVGKMELHYSLCDVAALAHAIAAIFASTAAERGVRLELATPPVANAQVDGDKVQRILMNLLSNAFKYAPDGSTVRLGMEESGTLLVITVEDAGPGVPLHLRDAIFDRFQQGDADTQRRYGGTGLGLSIVKEFVALHGGTVTVADSREGGALFRVSLPLHAPPGAQVHSAAAEPHESLLNRFSAPPRGNEFPASPVEAPSVLQDGGVRPVVLVVEDNRDMREFICRILAQDAQTRVAPDGRAALEAMRDETPDLILTDMMMPVMTGQDLITAVRADPRLSEIPVIMLTAKADDDLKLNLLAEGAQDYVMKPFSIEELLARVRNQLRNKAIRDTLRRALTSRSDDLAAMARELAQAKESAEQASAAKDDFLAVLSHELRTPLTPALVASSALLRNPLPAADELRENLAIVQRNIELEARLVDDLLDITRITRGKLRFQAAPVELHTILRDAVAIGEPELRAKNITWRLESPSDPASVRGDATRLTQVFANLLTNAAKFTPEGGSVTVRCTVRNKEAQVEVQDSGIGIPPEILPHIFEPFRQGEAGTTRRFGGLGLGLSVAKGLVEAHGGRIEAQSEGLHRGSTFIVTLPVLVGDGAPAAANLRAAPSRSTTGLRVLLVEDHEDTRNVLQRLISRAGHHVVASGSVGDAQKAITEGAFDLLLSDLGLPDGTGVEVLAALHARQPKCPAVVMSGYGMDADLERTRAAGFSEHLVKPVAADALYALLGRYAAAAKSEAGAAAAAEH